MTLDQYFPVQKQPEPTTAVEVRCSKCRKIIQDNEAIYRLGKKDEERVYCQACAKKILRPREDSEESI